MKLGPRAESVRTVEEGIFNAKCGDARPGIVNVKCRVASPRIVSVKCRRSTINANYGGAISDCIEGVQLWRNRLTSVPGVGCGA